MSMNIFRLAGDMTHLVSFFVLLLKMRSMKSCAGISLRTQELYTLVFITRYLDLFIRFISLYNTVMKMFYIAASVGIVYYMRYHKVVSQTYDKEQDTFRSLFLLGPSAGLALLIHTRFTFIEVLWTFSIYLESVAILPQLVLLQRTGNVDNLTGNYVFLLGAYRGLYIFNWIYRFFTEPGYRAYIAWIAGILQTAIYADFFYYYLKAWKENKKLKLPA